jgi:hypothetical protein
MKLNIRLPSDTGPNPYDSRTSLNDLPENKWLVSVGWWATIIMLGLGFVFGRWVNGSL